MPKDPSPTWSRWKFQRRRTWGTNVFNRGTYGSKMIFGLLGELSNSLINVGVWDVEPFLWILCISDHICAIFGSPWYWFDVGSGSWPYHDIGIMRHWHKQCDKIKFQAKLYCYFKHKKKREQHIFVRIDLTFTASCWFVCPSFFEVPLEMDAIKHVGRPHPTLTLRSVALWLTVCYWKWPFIVDLPIKNGDFP